MVLPDSRKVSRAPRYSGAVPESSIHFAYGTVTLYGEPFQAALTMNEIFDFLSCELQTVLQPRQASLSVWAFPSSLAATGGIDISFFSLGTEMFQFPKFSLLWPMNSAMDLQTFYTLEGLPHSEISG